jgi:hypothetical protein
MFFIHWIDLEDELPPRGIDVLLACADGVQQGVRRGDLLRSYLRSEPVHDATHWAMLPQHPLNEEPDPWLRSEAAGIAHRTHR